MRRAQLNSLSLKQVFLGHFVAVVSFHVEIFFRKSSAKEQQEFSAVFDTRKPLVPFCAKSFFHAAQQYFGDKYFSVFIFEGLQYVICLK